MSRRDARSEHEGDPPAERKVAVDLLFSAAYEELRRLAASVRRSDRAALLTPTTLVNEAWLKLAGSPPLTPESRLHFKRIAARAMREVLVDAARRRKAHKRGGGAMVTWDDAVDGVEATADDILRLNEALQDLSRIQPRQAMMIEYRFFGGLGIADTAEVLGVSEATILRDWRVARAWLAAELRRER